MLLLALQLLALLLLGLPQRRLVRPAPAEDKGRGQRKAGQQVDTP